MTREDAIRIIETVFKSKETYKYYDCVTHQALNMAIEALSIVRCKDCKHGEERLGDYRCRKLDEDWDIRFSPTHFCSWAERREP